METIRDMRMRQIAETINREPDNWNRIRECIRTVGLSSAYLSVRFKDAAGLPMRSYALWMKFEHACEMVIAGERPSEAALKAGFADQSHLGRAARRFAKKSFWRAIHELSQELETNNASGSEVRTGAA
jgi:AraC-like DNA-binding protein